jgi:hypothetical protein
MSTDYFADDPRTNLERMLAGDLYIADDPEIARRQQQAVRLAARYQAAYAEDADAARPLLAQLLGFLGDEAHVRPPLYVDYGSNITIGARTFVNYNLTALDVGADLAVLADGDGRDVQCGEVVVDEGARPDGDVAAVVDVQGRPDVGLFAERAEQFGEDRPGGVGVLGVAGLVASGQAYGLLLPAGDLRIVGDVEVARLHALEVRARILREVVRRHAHERTPQSVRTYILRRGVS